MSGRRKRRQSPGDGSSPDEAPLAVWDPPVDLPAQYRPPSPVAICQRFPRLNYRRALFVLAYLFGPTAGNATRSYIKVYPNSSEESARRGGSLLLTNIDIQGAINWSSLTLSDRVGLTAEAILTEARVLAQSSIIDYAEWGDDEGGGWVRVKESAQVPREVLGAIQEIQQTDKGLRIKLHSKAKPLELAIRHLGLITDKQVSINANIDLENMTDAQLAALAGVTNTGSD